MLFLPFRYLRLTLQESVAYGPIGLRKAPDAILSVGQLVGAGLTIGRDCEKKTSFQLGPRFCLETPHRKPQMFGYDFGNC